MSEAILAPNYKKRPRKTVKDSIMIENKDIGGIDHPQSGNRTSFRYNFMHWNLSSQIMRQIAYEVCIFRYTQDTHTKEDKQFTTNIHMQ